MVFRSFKKSIWLMLISIAFLLFSSYIWYPGHLITPYQYVGFFDNVEMAIPTVLIAFCCFILPNKYEIELSLVCGTSTSKLFFSKALPVFVYTLIPTFIMLALFRYIPYEGDIRPRIPIFVPENYRIYAAVSLFVTVFFFFALFCFLRVIMRNCYAPIFLCMFANKYFYDLSKQIQKGAEDIRKSLVNPFISNYILGDTVPNAYVEQMEGMEIMRNAWTYNRIGFFVLGVVLLVVTYLLLRREKLHKGFGD